MHQSLMDGTGPRACAKVRVTVDCAGSRQRGTPVQDMLLLPRHSFVPSWLSWELHARPVHHHGPSCTSTATTTSRAHPHHRRVVQAAREQHGVAELLQHVLGLGSLLALELLKALQQIGSEAQLFIRPAC